MEATIQNLQVLITREALGSPVAAYMTGSSCDGGLRPESDLDILLITRVQPQVSERRILVEHLLGHSGRRAAKQPGWPVELTCLVLDDIKPWRYPAMRDFLYGEWLRADYEAGLLPTARPTPTFRSSSPPPAGTPQC